MTNQMEATRFQVCEQDVAIALHAVRLSRPRISDVVAVVGDNDLAVATVAVLLARGVSQVALVIKGGASANGAPQAGVAVFAPPVSEESLRQIQTRLGAYGPDFVFGCDGKPKACQLAIELVRPAGMVVLLAQDAEPIFMNPNLLVFPDKRVKGSGRPNDVDLRIARELIRAGQIRLSSDPAAS